MLVVFIVLRPAGPCGPGIVLAGPGGPDGP